MNIKIKEFQQAIVNFINESELPIEVKRLSLAEIMHKLESAADAVIAQELKEREEANGN